MKFSEDDWFQGHGNWSVAIFAFGLINIMFSIGNMINHHYAIIWIAIGIFISFYWTGSLDFALRNRKNF